MTDRLLYLCVAGDTFDDTPKYFGRQITGNSLDP